MGRRFGLYGCFLMAGMSQKRIQKENFSVTDIIATDAEEVATLDDSLVEGLAISKPSRSQRKPVKATREMVAPLASVEPICVDNLMLKTDGSSVAHFWRLKYKGCPKADSNNKNTGNKNPSS